MGEKCKGKGVAEKEVTRRTVRAKQLKMFMYLTVKQKPENNQ